jgi:hypothetical protein
MEISFLIENLEASGVAVDVEAGTIRLHADDPSAITEEVVSTLKERKAEAVSYLQNRSFSVLQRLGVEKLENRTAAACGSPDCRGCYEVEPGVHIHPPKSGKEWLEWLMKWEPKDRDALQ